MPSTKEMEGNSISPGSLEEYEEASESLKELANLAPSENVREILLYIIEEMSSDLYTSNNFLDLGNQLYPESRMDIDKDLNFWKNTKKLVKKVYDIYLLAKRIWELLQQINHTIRNKNHEKAINTFGNVHMDKLYCLWDSGRNTPASDLFWT